MAVAGAPPTDDPAAPEGTRPDHAAMAGAHAPGTPPMPPLEALRAIRLTRWGLWWEAAARALWPAFAWGLAGIAALALGAGDALPARALAPAVGLWLAVLALMLMAGAVRMARPGRAEAAARVDAALPGRPLAALRDRVAVGLGDLGAAALWRAHLAQMQATARRARPVPGRAGLARRDPLGLRLAALTALAMAVLFGSAGQLGQGLGALASTLGGPLARAPGAAAGPGWEGWAAPPDYTRRPVIYLNALPPDAVLRLPKGSRVTFRLYGERARLAQDIGPAAPDAPPAAPAFTADTTGTITVAGRRIAVEVLPDDPPAITPGAAPQRRADGRLVQAFSARDDNGLASAEAVVTLDLGAVDRRYGLAPAPEPRAPLTLQLPLPARGARTEVTASLVSDLSQHPLANLPVTISLRASDGIGQTGTAPPMRVILPGRRFFDPLAAALIELRRDLLWSRANAGRSAQLLRAAIWQPDGFAPPQLVQLLHGAITRLEGGPALSPADRDQIAAMLWTAAVQLEDGGLADALAAMQRAQQRLSEAMRGGATPDEVKRLMDELKAATDAYTRMLAEQGEADPSERFVKSQPGERITGDQIQAMMDEVERLMNEGRMAEAQELLEQFNRMMENLKVTQGPGGEGDGTGGAPGSPQRRLADTLRDQQQLADEGMRQLQQDFLGTPPQAGEGPGARPGEGQPGDGQPGAGQSGEGESGAGQSGQGQSSEGESGEGQPGAGQGGAGADLADRQQRLRQGLDAQRGMLPGPGTQEGEAARQQLDRAGRAMAEAEEALRGGDPGGAMDRQAEAIEAMREGLRALGRLQGEGEGQGRVDASPQPAPEGTRPGGRPDPGQAPLPYLPRPPTDPLGRDTTGAGSTITTGDDLPEGAGDPANRSRALLDEIRRRTGELTRPEDERNYLRRLLDQF